MKKKKLRFHYCTALFAATLLVGTNCVAVQASEPENIETRAPALMEDPPDESEKTEDTASEPESPASDSENPIEDTTAESEDENPDSEIPTEETASDSENMTGVENVQTENIVLDSETTVPDLEETESSNDVSTICARIDDLPTVDQLYADAPGVDDAVYDAWLSAMQELFRQICELQEQYRLLTMEEQGLVGAARKAKLDALGMLQEEGSLFGVDDLFDKENGLSYKIIIENGTDNQVSVTTSSNYGVSLSGAIQIPSAIEHNGIEYKVTSIDDQAFKDCQNLTSVSIPESVQSIGKSSFFNCRNLTDITIHNGIQINNKSFEDCTNLSTMKIIIEGDTPVSVTDKNAFLNCPTERQIIFQAPDGTELSSTTTPSLTSVVNLYKAAADGNTDDYLWYGWQLKVPAYTVTINVQKDSKPWQDHDRKFALKASDSDALLTDLSDIKNGKYYIYDITNAQTPLDTQVMIEVKDSNVSNVDPVAYYTVTFFDDDTPYETDTPQSPQIILKNNYAVKPSADPVKNGFLFEKWVTANGSAEEFDFSAQKITAPTAIYASWTPVNQPDEYKVIIEVYLDGEKWIENCPKTFALKAKSSGALTSDLNAVAGGQYDIYEISAGETDTNVDIDVSGADASARIDYYTIQFLDENIPYGNDTPQKPQIILKGQYASQPEAPNKEGYTFSGWKTGLESDVLYDFENTVITDKVSLHAIWVLADGGDQPGDGDEKPGGDENNPGGGDQQPGDGENNPDGGDQQPGDGDNNPGGGDENKPGDGDNNPGGGDQQPGDGDNNPGGGDQQPGDGENNPGGGNQQPGDGDGKPDDGDNNPGGGDQQPGDGDNKPGGGDDQQPGDNNSGGGDSNPGDGDNNKPGNGENKPSDGSDKQPDTGENKPTNGNQQPPNDNNAQNQNKEHSTNIGSSVDAAPFSTTQITDLPSEDNAINSAPFKDQEPQTGDEASTGIYIITAILASLALALLHVLESFDTGDPIHRVKQHTSIPFRTHITHNTQKLKKKDRAFEIIWTRRKQYSFSSG